MTGPDPAGSTHLRASEMARVTFVSPLREAVCWGEVRRLDDEHERVLLQRRMKGRKPRRVRLQSRHRQV